MTVEDRIIRLRRDVAASWAGNDPILNQGEMGLELDTRKFKFGDGTTDWNSLPYATTGNTGGFYAPSSSLGSPKLITAIAGVTTAGVSREYQSVAGNGGPVVVSASPVIAAGSTAGNELVLEGTSNANSVTLPQSGAGIDLNGTAVLKAGSRLYLIWNGSVWGEVARK